MLSNRNSLPKRLEILKSRSNGLWSSEMDFECFYKLFWDRRAVLGALVTIVSGVGGVTSVFGICTLYNLSNDL